MLKMSSQSLFKRKLRSILTILGVVVGTASIVVMISLGLGLKRSALAEIESSTSLTSIEVYDNHMEDSAAKHLTESVRNEILAMEHVDDVFRELDYNAIIIAGQYSMPYAYIMGVDDEKLESLDIVLEEGGRLPKGDDAEISLLYGVDILESLQDKSGKSFYETGILPNIDLMKEPVMIVYDTAAYRSGSGSDAQDSSEDDMSDTVETKAMAKKYLIKTAGIISPASRSYTWGIYTNIDRLTDTLKKVFKNKAIPGQPLRKNGKPFTEIFYSSFTVQADDMNNVAAVEEEIKNTYGFSAYSNVEYVEDMQNEFRSIQLMLGGVGSISLFVAAIGIANTMMMSIYERTKEIGVMKVLGCSLSNIRTLFLLEAAYIGFIGGIIGIVLSYVLSAIVNLAAGRADPYLDSISYIPIWLSPMAVVFAVAVGVISGLLPSIRAMRLSPLAAIRNE